MNGCPMNSCSMDACPRFHLLGILIPFQEKLLVAIPTDFWFIVCDVLRDFVPFVQFKKREKHPWRNVNFSKVTG